MAELFKNSRRTFIRNSSAALVGALAIPEIVSSAFAVAKPKKIVLKDGDVVLFQGDSITDWGRSRTQTDANISAGIGTGYPIFAAGELLTKHTEKNLQIFNRGVSGDKVFQLADRWDKDCISLKPTILSILIGVNDFWAIAKHGYTGTLDTYKNDYIKLIDRTQKALPGVRLILGEPFALLDVKDVDLKWYPKFNDYRQAARDVAGKFDVTFIPYQTIFDEAVKKAPASYWTIDGVHPSIAGANLMAQAWLETVKS